MAVEPNQNYHPLIRSISNGLKRRAHVPASARLLVAVSGGADSVALLHALNLLRNRRGWALRLQVGHVQHHLHSQAEAHARFVEALAKELKLPFERGDVDVQSAIEQHGGNVEAVARRLRYQALREMAEHHDAAFVVTAHHGDDQLETLLMRLMTGSGMRGIRGLRWRRKLAGDSEIRLVRPMLNIDRATVEDFLSQAKLPFCTDPTNADATRTRARLRTEVLPVLRAMRPSAAVASTQTADQIAMAQRAIRDMTQQVRWRAIASGHEIERATLRELPEALALESLRFQCGRVSGRLLRQVIHAVRDTKGGERTFDLPNDQRIIITAKLVSILEIP